MSTSISVTVPDIGDFEDVEVIEILVAVGDIVAVEDPLVTLESDKATMDIPAPQAGRVAEITVALGDKISEGSVIVIIAVLEDDRPSGDVPSITPEPAAAIVSERSASPVEAAIPQPGSIDNGGSLVSVAVPDIGDFDEVDVIEILVNPGDVVALEDPLITLESDKATMDIPAPCAGRIEQIHVVVGDKIAQGHIFATIAAINGKSSTQVSDSLSPPSSPVPNASSPAAPPPAAATRPTALQAAAEPPSASSSPSTAYASPGIRKFARELGVDIARVTGTGRKARILKVDVQSFVKSALKDNRSATTSHLQFLEIPVIDFAKFGPIKTQPLSKIKRLTGQNLHRSWLAAPHVTQFDEADITELESFRKSKIDDAKENNVKLTLLAFLIKAVVVVLNKLPDFNASLSPDGESIIHKQYFNIGIAVNTERGLVVPVIRDADKKGLYQLADELGTISQKARAKKLTPADMQGGCFTISSLGGVGGTAFTPIINVPEVAILGVSSSLMKPVYVDDEFVPRLMLPLALSYDHRVIDGVAGAQFTSQLGMVLSDIRHILL